MIILETFNKLGPEKYWILGMLATDGSIRQCNKYFSVTQCLDAGEERIKIFSDLLNIPYRKAPTPSMSGSSIYVCGKTSKPFCDMLASFGIVPAKSLILEYPKQKMSEPELANFIGGIIDGDGCVGIYDNGSGIFYLEITICGTENFVTGIQKALPFNSKIYRYKNGNSYNIHFNGKHAVLLGEWLTKNGALWTKSVAYLEFIEKSKINPPRWMSYLAMHKDIQILLDKGISPLKIAKQFGISFQVIYNWINIGKLSFIKGRT